MLRLNQNNLEEYLKKTEAEQIYMKKINSINMSFTSLLTSIQSVFSTYDYQLSTLNNAINVVNYNTSVINFNTSTMNLRLDSIVSSINSNYNSIQSLSSDLSNLNGSFTTFKTSVNEEISNLWAAMSGNNNYNFFKEFAKPTQNTYKNMDDNRVIIDDEQFEYIDSNLGSYTLINPNKLEYYFASNIISTTSGHQVNLGGEYSRLGFRIPSDDNPQNWFNGAASSVYIYQDGIKNLNTNNYLKCMKAYLCNGSGTNSFNYISTNLNAQIIDMWNYTRSNNGSFTTFYLNDRVEQLSGFTGMEKVYLDIRRPNTNTKPLYITGYYPESVALSFSYHGPTEYGYHIGPISQPKLATFTLYQPENLKWTINSATLYGSTTNVGQSYTLTHNSDMLGIYLLNVILSPGVSFELPEGLSKNSFSYSINNSNNNNNSYKVSNWTMSRFCLTNASALNAQNNSMSVFNIVNDLNGFLNTLTFLNNTITSMTVSSYQLNMLNFNNNTVKYMTLQQYIGSVGASFGENFRNSSLIFNAFMPNTYYSYNNPDATLKISNGKCKFDYFTASECNCSGGPGFEIAVFSTLNISANNNYYYNNGGWKYVSCNSFGLTNPEYFYNGMLSQDGAFFHCPFIQLGTTCLSNAINQGKSVLSHQNVLVDNDTTTSIDLHLSGNHTSESVHPDFIHDQKYIISADIRGWHPTRIINFDQSYLFNNVASEYSLLPEYKFTAHVDNVNDWNAYKGFFNPFGDGQGNDRVIFVNN